MSTLSLHILNARNYRQPECPDIVDIPQFRTNGSLVHGMELTEDPQESRKNVYQHPYHGHDDELCSSPTRPVHAVTVSGALLSIEEN
jgi:hypothetical protein